MRAPASGPANRFVAAVQGVFGARLLSVVTYGPPPDGAGDTPLSSLVLVASLTVGDLEACAAMSHGWQRERIMTPLLVTEHEFRRSLDAFPLEYAEIQHEYTIRFGADPFAGVTIEHADLRRACEAQVKSHLLHLREGFIEAGGSPRAVGELVSAAAPAFASLLRNIARLQGATLQRHLSATLEGARLAQLPEAVVAEVLALERPAAVATADPWRLFPDYLAAVERLALFIDGWKS